MHIRIVSLPFSLFYERVVYAHKRINIIYVAIYRLLREHVVLVREKLKIERVSRRVFNALQFIILLHFNIYLVVGRFHGRNTILLDGRY